MGLSFLFGSYARTVGVGDTTVQWCCPLPRKPRQVYHNLAYNINNASSNTFLSARHLRTAPLFANSYLLTKKYIDSQMTQ